MKSPLICAVVVTYNPDITVFDNLGILVTQFGHVVVVDNGSCGPIRELMSAITGVWLISLAENQGVATALNCGIRYVAKQGCSWVVTFDQDSRPELGLVSSLAESAARLPGVGVVGPRILECALGSDYRWLRPNPRFPLFFQRINCGGRDLENVTMVITSGAMTSVEAWQSVGGFDEGLFIDFVDTDFCLRLRRAGWRIAVSAGARLNHKLGRRERRYFLGRTFYPTHHIPLRHYYIARNRIPMLFAHSIREPHWMFFECAAAALWFFRVVVFEQKKLTKIKAMILGTRDAVLGRSGPCPVLLARELGA